MSYHSLCKYMVIFSLCASSVWASPKAYVTNAADNSVSVIDLLTNQIAATLSVGTKPDNMVLINENLYVANSGASNLSVIDTKENKTTESMTVGDDPKKVVGLKSSPLLMVTTERNGQLAFLNPVTKKIEKTITIPHANALAYDATQNVALIGTVAGEKSLLMLVNTATQSVINSLPFSSSLQEIQFSPDGKEWYISRNGIDALEVWDAQTHQLLKRIDTGKAPQSITFTRDGSLGWAVSPTVGMVYVFDPKTYHMLEKINVGGKPTSIAVSHDNKLVYVTDILTNKVNVIDVTTKKLMASITVGKEPRQILLNEI